MRNDVPPERELVPADFDGHLERPLLQLTADERLDWIWAGMELLFVGRTERNARRTGELVAPSIAVAPTRAG